MTIHRSPIILLSLASALVCGAMACAADALAQGASQTPSNTPPAGSPQAAIAKMAGDFVEAFQRGDAQALAGFWTPDGDLVDLEGRVLSGRDAIAADYAELFRENKNLGLRIEVLSLRFPTADTAVEDGVTSVIGPVGSLPVRTRYTNTLVKRDGRWFLSSVREAPYVPPSHFEHLRGLDWMIGAWAEPGEGPSGAQVLFEWTADRNFIVASRAVRVGNALLDSGTERIGWDPAAKLIRSWSFEPDGGFGQGTWTRSGDTWTTRSSSVLSSGSLMTSTSIVTHVDPDTVTWQSKDRQVDGKPLPDSPVVTMKRLP